ncbi:diguanylate cyclase [Geothrix sp. 21YS21S-2]|uniref:GGDEF domain-containing protein n=1 Tax=Geothrix sp. 21YS21S-2 TaxID=3068893 RepID=UPI0027B99063|nr:diguanylate cyclase [Geothrix sp. 21YS21S-2]
MDLLAITRHHGLVEALRTAFGGTGHSVERVEDPLEALALEAWNRARLVLVDAEADPMDGYRLCSLLRGESRMLFRHLPVLLVVDHLPTQAERDALAAVDGDGFVEVDSGVHRLQKTLGPLLDGTAARDGGDPVPALAMGIRPETAGRMREAVAAIGLDLRTCARQDLEPALAALRPPILFLGVDASGEQALEVLRTLDGAAQAPSVILVGGKVPEATQCRLLDAGARDWVPLPLSVPLLLHGCRCALEWTHLKRLKLEYQHQLQDMAERRGALEREACTLRSEVLTDPLTELLNRRAFSQHLEHAVSQWERNRRPFVLILGDLDYFKLTNDRFGHLVGDAVLKAVGQRIRSSLRRSDLAFRIGGEEFAILLMETSLRAGTEVAEKIRERIEAAPLKVESGQTVFPTMSFGVGAPDGEDSGRLFLRVDEALYLAKHKGRNRVEVMSNQ